MTSAPVFDAVTLASLAASLAIFVALTAAGRTKRREEAVDFGAAFSAFLAGWMATELLEVLAPASWSDIVSLLHFAVLASFAAWMTLRWRWSLRRAREAP